MTSAAYVGPSGSRARDPSVADAYAAWLLKPWGLAPARGGGADPHPALDWARCGAMALSGEPEGPPRLAPGPLAACARGAVRALEGLVGGALPGVGAGPALLGERAALRGLRRQGRVAPGGACRLLRARDAWLALNLARPDDVALLPAWLETAAGGDPWQVAARGLARRSAAEWEERARLLGLPAAVARAPDPTPPPWLRFRACGRPRPPAPRARPLVVDLSSLWAGPLCTHLLERAGARVVKLESRRRPDAVREGTPALFDLLHAGKASVVLDFDSPADRAALVALLERADVVVESARPRALAQLGIDAAARVASRPGLSWVRITGYGPDSAGVAFGDDAGVAAGLAVATGSAQAPLFCGDAVADPLTGLHAAVAALASFRRGGGAVLDLALRDVCAHALGFGSADARVRRRGRDWEVVAGGARAAVAPPRARAPSGRARPLGVDTRALLRGATC